MLPCKSSAAALPGGVSKWVLRSMLRLVNACHLGGYQSPTPLGIAACTELETLAFLLPFPPQALLGAVGILTPEYLQRQVRVQLPLASLFMLRTVPLGCCPCVPCAP